MKRAIVTAVLAGVAAGAMAAAAWSAQQSEQPGSGFQPKAYFIMPLEKDPSRADVVMHFEDATFSPNDPPLRLKPGAKLINYGARDVSKSNVARACAAAFGHPLAVDPRLHVGPAVEKSEINAAHDGRIVQLAFAQDSKVAINLMPIMLKRLVYTGSTLRSSPDAFKTEIARQLEARVWPLFAQGKLRTVTTHTFPLAEAAKAHALMESAKHTGKILLVP